MPARIAGSPFDEPTQRRAFTLVELLVVIAVIIVLAAILIPVINSARDSAIIAKDASNMRQIYSAMGLYANEHGGKLPFGEHEVGGGTQAINWWSNPSALAKGLVGEDGSAGYLPNEPSVEGRFGRAMFSDVMLSSGDPNREFYIDRWGVPHSYIYRHSDIASGTLGGGKPICLGDPNFERPRWLLMGRYAAFVDTPELPHSTRKRYKVSGHPMPPPASLVVDCPWYGKAGTNVLYEDGSVQWRSYAEGQTVGQR